MTSVPKAKRASFVVTGRFVLATLVGFFVVVAGVNAVMISSAIRTFGGVETENAYKAGLAFNDAIAAAEAQDARRWRVEITKSAQPGADFIIDVRDAAGQPVGGLALDAWLKHPTDSRHDHPLEVVQAAAGRYHVRTGAEAGQWDLVIALHDDKAELFRSRNRIVLR